MLPCEDVQRRVPTSECADAQDTRRMPAGLIKGGADPPRIFYGTAPGTREAAIAAVTVLGRNQTALPERAGMEADRLLRRNMPIGARIQKRATVGESF